MTTPREALSPYLRPPTATGDEILTALAPFLLPKGCIAVCERCGNPFGGECGFPLDIDYTGEKFATPCPIRPKPKNTT